MADAAAASEPMEGVEEKKPEGEEAASASGSADGEGKPKEKKEKKEKSSKVKQLKPGQKRFEVKKVGAGCFSLADAQLWRNCGVVAAPEQRVCIACCRLVHP